MANLSSVSQQLVQPFTEPNPLNRQFHFVTANVLTAYRESLSRTADYLAKDVTESLVFRGYFEYITIPLVLVLICAFLLYKLVAVLTVQRHVLDVISLLKSEELDRLVTNCSVYMERIQDAGLSVVGKHSTLKEFMVDASSPIGKVLDPQAPRSSRIHEDNQLEVQASTERNLLMSRRRPSPRLNLEDHVEKVTSSKRERSGKRKQSALPSPKNVKQETNEREDDVDGLPSATRSKRLLTSQSSTVSRRLFFGFLWKMILMVLVCLSLVFTRLGLEISHYSQAKSTIQLMGYLYKVKSDLRIAECLLYSEAHKKKIGNQRMTRPVGSFYTEHSLPRQREFPDSDCYNLFQKHGRAGQVHRGRIQAVL